MILRELIDRGEITLFAVLFPPHLVEQRAAEFAEKFDIDAVAVTAASAPRLERDLPPGISLFEAHAFTIVSLDYIKADRRRDEFARVCPAVVVVDEAHACVGTESGRQQRFGPLQRLADDRERQMILLTATPHSGDDVAFGRLLGLLDPEFGEATLDSDAAAGDWLLMSYSGDVSTLRSPEPMGRTEARTAPFRDTKRPRSPMPSPRVTERSMRRSSTGALASSRGPVTTARSDGWPSGARLPCCAVSAVHQKRRRLRCAIVSPPCPTASRPAFSISTMTKPRPMTSPPTGAVARGDALAALISQAGDLGPDPKPAALVKVLGDLENPVVFCRFIATAGAVGAELRRKIPKARVEVVTGALPTDERRARVDAMLTEDEARRILVATDCLSEGINLQALFDAVTSASSRCCPSTSSASLSYRRRLLDGRTLPLRSDDGDGRIFRASTA